MSVKYYGMFTDIGNIEVDAIVNVAKIMGLSWLETYALLCKLADTNPEKFGEATDTVVREYVYDACGFETNFYV